MNNITKWLEHIETSIPEEAFGYPVSMYSVALEGWRRGLSLKFKNNFRVKAVTPYVLSGYGKEIEFAGTRSHLVKRKAINICSNKEVTKEYLLKGNVKTPIGDVFDHTAKNEDILSYADKLGYPIVLKPSNASGGQGVIANIKNEKDFMNALQYVRKDLGFSKVIVEQFIEGKDYRLYVIDDEVVGAFYRIPANVLGDGKSTIQQLFQAKKKNRSKNPGIHNQRIKIENETIHLLKSQGYTMESIPKEGETVYLKTTSNISSGGDSVDATEDLPLYIKQEAVKAVKSIPGLIQGGVDVLYSKELEEFAIIEVNSQPSIRAHLFPMEGMARDVPRAIIDYYFPETINNRNITNPLYYFDIDTVFSSFQSCITSEVSIPNAPQYEVYAREYRIVGKVYKNGYLSWIQKQARTLRINGYVKYLSKNEIAVFSSGSKKNMKEFNKILNNEKPRKVIIESIIDSGVSIEDLPPIKIGFELRVSKQNQSAYNKKLKLKLKKLRNDNTNQKRTLNKEINYYRNLHNQMLQSTSWKITKPIRYIGAVKNNLKK